MRIGLRQFHFRWEWLLGSDAEALWPLVADTNRFNREAGVPAVEVVGRAEGGGRRLRLARFGVGIEWEEQPFEWLQPCRFGVVRRYLSGPIAEMEVAVELVPREGGGTLLVYQVWVRPRNLLGLVAIPVEIGWHSRRRFGAVFRDYDRIALSGGEAPGRVSRARLAPGGGLRLQAAAETLRAKGLDPLLVERLADAVAGGDEPTLARLRPYALADVWRVPRRPVLELCLEAVRAGLLDLRWDVLCPLCRGVPESGVRLGDLARDVHCESCNTDFAVNFEHSVELSFVPNPAVRGVERREFCVGGPRVTPHVVLQQVLEPGQRGRLLPVLEPGRYRLRARELRGHRPVLVTDDGGDGIVKLDGAGWPAEELRLSTAPALDVENASGRRQLLLLERTAWIDDAATAADVMALQVFRDLFAAEALRPHEPISVGSLAVLFTDLRDSTRFYREVGDASAFGSVLAHLDVMRAAVVDEDGAVVKTMGDAVMAVFRRPVGALRAALAAQQALTAPVGGGRRHLLKVGIHLGPCIAVNQNDRLDYFGSTVNAAARLVALSDGDDVVVSDVVRADPEVREFLDQGRLRLTLEPLDAELKGFEERLQLWRLTASEQPERRSLPVSGEHVRRGPLGESTDASAGGSKPSRSA